MDDITKDSIMDAESPSDISEAVSDEWQESYDSDATSFSQLESGLSLSDMSSDVYYLTATFRNLLNNIIDSGEITDKIAAIKSLSKELSDRMDALISAYDAGSTQTDAQKSLFTKTKEMFEGLFKEAAFKTEAGMKFHAGDYAYVPDKTKPSTWKLRLTEKPGAKPTKAQLGRAAAAFSSGGFRGNRVQLPSSAVASAKQKIRSAYRAAGVKSEDVPDSVKEKKGLMIVKQADGQYRWFAFHSNAYRDSDNPSEILTSAAHEKWVERVDKKELPMPELWHWHVPGSKWGQGDLVAYDKENKTTFSSGLVLKGHEAEAEAYMNADEDIAVSHGMPPDTVKYDQKDKSLVVEYVTREISDLPPWAAANKLTTFFVMKEDRVSIPQVKLDYLKQHGVTDEQIALIEAQSASISKEAAEAGLESKEVKPVETPVAGEKPAETQPVTENKEATPAAETKPVDAPVSEEKKEEKPATTPPASAENQEKKEAQPATGFVTQAEFSSLSQSVASLAQSMAGLLKEIKEKSDTDAKAKEAQSLTPTASMAAFLSQQMRAIGSKEASIDGRSNLAKDGPAENKEQSPTIVKTELPILDNILTGIVTGKSMFNRQEQGQEE